MRSSAARAITATILQKYPVVTAGNAAHEWTVMHMSVELQVAALGLCFMALGVLADEMVRMWIKWRR